jgi:hypothetical protein
MRLTPTLLALVLLTSTASAKPLIGGPKTIPLNADGSIPSVVVGAQAGMGGYVSGAQKVAVPLVAVAFETHSKAHISKSHREWSSSKDLELRLKVDDEVLAKIAEQLQGIVEQDLKSQGFEILPKDTIDNDARWQGIAKDASIGTETKDNFMSGFGGNGTFNRWFTSGGRPLFGIGATGALSELSPLIHIARDKKISLLFYRFKVQFCDVDAKNTLFFDYVKGKNVLHMVSADMAVFTPEHTLGAMVKLKADLTAGTDFIQNLQTISAGNYVVVADPQQYEADTLSLIKAVSRQFAEFLKNAK